MKYIDLSHPIFDGMPAYPGENCIIKTVATVEEAGYNLTHMTAPFHIGTHVDCSAHMTSNPKMIADYPIEKWCGIAQIIDVPDNGEIGPEYFENITSHIVLMRSGYDRFYGTKEYYYDQPRLTLDAAKLLISKGVTLMGFDFSSPDPAPFDVHRYLLQQDILIIENLTGLDKIKAHETEFYAVPLKLMAEGSYVRAFAVER